MANAIGTREPLNSALVKVVRLSETTKSGSPYAANMVLNLAMVLDDDAEGTISTSNHLECMDVYHYKEHLPLKGLA